MVLPRVVSLVPSLTEAVAASCPDSPAGVLVGATDWCTHPADLDARGVVRVRGTKNPDLERIVELAPDLVLANVEENREVDLAVLREAGLAVLVTDIRTLDGDHGAFEELDRMLQACGLGHPPWLDDARRAWDGVTASGTHPPFTPRRRALVPIWRRPWMAVGSDTFTGAVLERLGVDNALADHTERYPRVDLDNLPEHDLVVLPDEPYPFTDVDGPEAFTMPSALVSGRHLTWYGPSLLDAPAVLSAQLRAVP